MDFKKILKQLADRVEGTQAVCLMGDDGIAVDSVNPGRIALDTVSAQFASFLKNLKLSNLDLDTGQVQQLSVATDRYITILSAVTPEYFVLMVLSAAGNYGRARFELGKAKFLLQDELS